MLESRSDQFGPFCHRSNFIPTFADFGLPNVLVESLTAAGITTPTPIQAQTLPDSLRGRDILGRGRTGSGKTYAFVLPLLARLAAAPTKTRPGRPRALILVPTRELATQVHASLAPLAATVGLRALTIFGGVSAGPQTAALRRGVDIVVACPGRLADHLSTGQLTLDAIEVTVLDEADHMADLGFLPVVRRLMDATPRQGQRMLFSATLDGDIDVLVRRFMHQPARHHVDSAQSPVSQMSHHVLHVQAQDRLPILIELTAAPGRVLVFTRTKHGAKRLARQLTENGVPAVELHGNLAQNARNRNLQSFADGTTATLVATDIAARGLHIDDVALVIHAEPPVEHKAYLHRSGRTARAGASGTVITVATEEQAHEVRDLARKAGISPTTSRVRRGDPLLAKLAPGERTFIVAAPPAVAATPANAGRRRRRPAPAEATMKTATGRSTHRSGAVAASTSSAAGFSRRSRVGRG